MRIFNDRNSKIYVQIEDWADVYELERGEELELRRTGEIYDDVDVRCGDGIVIIHVNSSGYDLLIDGCWIKQW